MTPLLPDRPQSAVEVDHPRLQQLPPSRAEQRARWEVRAAQWRAREVAEEVFGDVVDMRLTGVRETGAIRGMLRLDVPFAHLDDHAEREARFLAVVAIDPVLVHVPLLYIIGPADVSTVRPIGARRQQG